jgi:hypothetical protein
MPPAGNNDANTRPAAEIDPTVRSAIVDAYYPRALSLPDTARSRAQAAYGVTSAVAAALIALGAFGSLGERPFAVQVLGFLALCGWLVAALLFMRAVSATVESVPAEHDADAFARAVVAATKRERQEIEKRLRLALGSAVVAAAVTVAALGAIVRVPASVQSVAATVDLSKRGQETVAALCGTPHQTIHGRLSESSLRERFLTITMDPTACQGRQVKLHVPIEDVVGVATDEPG